MAVFTGSIVRSSRTVGRSAGSGAGVTVTLRGRSTLLTSVHLLWLTAILGRGGVSRINRLLGVLLHALHRSGRSGGGAVVDAVGSHRYVRLVGQGRRELALRRHTGDVGGAGGRRLGVGTGSGSGPVVLSSPAGLFLGRLPLCLFLLLASLPLLADLLELIRSTLGAVSLHGHVSIEMVKRSIRLLTPIPSTLVHALNLLIPSTRSLILGRTGDRDKRVNLRKRVIGRRVARALAVRLLRRNGTRGGNHVWRTSHSGRGWGVAVRTSTHLVRSGSVRGPIMPPGGVGRAGVLLITFAHCVRTGGVLRAVVAGGRECGTRSCYGGIST